MKVTGIMMELWGVISPLKNTGNLLRVLNKNWLQKMEKNWKSQKSSSLLFHIAVLIFSESYTTYKIYASIFTFTSMAWIDLIRQIQSPSRGFLLHCLSLYNPLFICQTELCHLFKTFPELESKTLCEDITHFRHSTWKNWAVTGSFLFWELTFIASKSANGKNQSKVPPSFMDYKSH